MVGPRYVPEPRGRSRLARKGGATLISIRGVNPPAVGHACMHAVSSSIVMSSVDGPVPGVNAVTAWISLKPVQEVPLPHQHRGIHSVKAAPSQIAAILYHSLIDGAFTVSAINPNQPSLAECHRPRYAGEFCRALQCSAQAPHGCGQV